MYGNGATTGTTQPIIAIAQAPIQLDLQKELLVCFEEVVGTVVPLIAVYPIGLAIFHPLWATMDFVLPLDMNSFLFRHEENNSDFRTYHPILSTTTGRETAPHGLFSAYTTDSLPSLDYPNPTPFFILPPIPL